MSARPELADRPSYGDVRGIGRSALVSGSVASIVSTVGLAVMAEMAGKAPLRPINATSHWLNGEHAGAFVGADARHTAVGYLTNHAACLFWAFFFEAWQSYRPARSGGELLRDAVLMSAIAAAVDYGATPKRFTPGWELVLSKTGMVGAYAALALGFAAGTMASRRFSPLASRAEVARS